MRTLLPGNQNGTVAGRFRRNRDGATAVEFALIAAPFLAIVFAIIETALVFFAGQVLQNGASDAARLVRTGQVQQQGIGADGFRSRLCDRVSMLLRCSESLRIDVRTYTDFEGIDPSSPIDSSGNLTDNLVFEPGQPGDIVVVRAFYEWPTFVPNIGINLANLANGNRLLVGAATFRNEPFSGP